MRGFDYYQLLTLSLAALMTRISSVVIEGAHTWLWVHSECRKVSKPNHGRIDPIVALAGARVKLKLRSKNSNAFSHGDQERSTSEAPPEAGRRTPATQLQLSN